MRIIAGLALGFILTCTAIWSQAISTSQINGTVRDATGLAVPGAEVRATQTATGAVRTVISGVEGSYVLTDLPIGPYQLEVSKEGFSRYVQSGIVLQVASNPAIEVVLKVGSVSERVQVEANASLVETRNSGVGQVVDNQRVLELPLNGRQATDLIYMTGMATTVNGAGLNSGVRNYPTADISVAGGLSNGLTYALDGATHNDPYNNLNLPLPFPDALQEFKVETSALPAQYGHHSSAAVNGVTKSGTNGFHGDLFEFLRNGAVNARNAFATSVDQLKRNQFGGTVGGPIRKDKLFFFAGQQTTILRTAPALNIAFIPTAQMLTGDFTAIAGPGCNTSGTTINLPASLGFNSNTISKSLFSQPAINIVTHAGFPTTTNPCGQFSFGRRTNSNDYNSLARIDYQWSTRHSLFGRYLQARFDQPSDYDASNLLAAATAALAFQVQSLVLGDTYLIGAGTVSSFRATLNRSAIPKVNPKVFSPSEVGIHIWDGVPGLVRIVMTNGFNLASNNETPSTYNTTDYQLSEDVSLVRGSHQIGIGVDWIHSWLNASSGLNASGPFTFNGQVTGLGLADFLLGKPSAFTQATTTLDYSRMNYVGLYVQDAWKATPKLTVNAGLRWDPYLPVSTKYGWTSHFDPALFAQGVRSSQYTNAPPGLMFPGDPGYPGKDVTNRRLNNFAPRVALAFDPKGDGRMSIRAAYGIFYDLPSHNDYVGMAQSPPFGNQTTVNFPASFADPWQGIKGGNPYPLTLSKDSPFINFGSYENFLLNPRTTYSQQWNLSIQRQLGADWLVSANYVGSSIIHLWGGNQANPGVYIRGTCGSGPCSTPTNVNTRRVLYLQDQSKGTYYGSISELNDGGTESYNGLLLSIQHRSAKGYSLLASYNWSHCISDLHNPELAVAGANFMIPGNRGADRSNCPLGDRRQVFNLSGVYETPRFSGAALRMLASGWHLSSIVRLQTGPYFTVLTGLDQALTGQTTLERPNQVLADPYTSGKPFDHYLNANAFQQPTLGTYGNLGANNILAPGLIQIDMGLTRTFRIVESKSLELRFEGFNLPNHLNPGPPNGLSGTGTSTGSTGLITTTVALNNPNFGRILSANDPRIMQIALKFVF